MGYAKYSYYSQIGEIGSDTIDPAVYGLGESANPAHEQTDPGYRPDFPPFEDTSNYADDPAYSQPWDLELGSTPMSPYEEAETLLGTQDRSRDTMIAGRPIDMPSWTAHQITGYGHDVSAAAGSGLTTDGGPEAVINQQMPPLAYDDVWTVERRDQEVIPTERGWAGGGNFVPGSNSLPGNNQTLDRWDRDAGTIDDFGEPLRQGVDVVVTVERDMIQPYGGNLVDGLIHYPHPMFDNIAAVPQAPSQFPDRAMDPGVDPYLPGGGMYSDWQRTVIPDSSTPQVEQVWAGDAGPDAVPDYEGTWE